MRVLFTLALVLATSSITARPTDLQEASSSVWTRLWSGGWAGIDIFLALAGYYDNFADVSNERNEATSMQVAVVGLGRTGTTSLALALEILGYKVIHDDEHFRLQDLYDEEDEGEITWDEFHEQAGRRGFNATFKSGYEWAKNHPEVKTILTVRDNPDKYVDSWLAAVEFIDTLKRPPYCWMPASEILMESFEDEYLNEPTGGLPDKYLDRDTLRKGYSDYCDKVKEGIPANRLLEFNVKQGWGPLCQFLNASVPEGILFPHVHDRTRLKGETYALRLLTFICFVVPLLICWLFTKIFKCIARARA